MGICGSTALVQGSLDATPASLSREGKVDAIIEGKGFSEDEKELLMGLPRYLIEKLYPLHDRLSKAQLILVGELQALILGGAASTRARSQAVEFRNYLRALTDERFITALRIWEATRKKLHFSEPMLDYLHGLSASQFIAAVKLLKQYQSLSVEFFTELFAGLSLEYIDFIQPRTLTYLSRLFTDDHARFVIALSVLEEANGHFALFEDDLERLVSLSAVGLRAKLTELNSIAVIAKREFGQQSWRLRPATLELLKEIRDAGSDHFTKLAAEIRKICETDKLMMSALNLDDIVAALILQRDMSERLTLVGLGALAGKRSTDGRTMEAVVIDRLARIRVRKQERLQRAIARSQDSEKFKLLMHHSLAHAAEVARRTIKLCEEFIPCFRDNHLLKAIVGFLAEFHDFEQQLGNPAAGLRSNEQLTVEAINQWLSDEVRGLYSALLAAGFVAADIALLKDFIEFLAHREIVIGTTMVFGSFADGTYNTDVAGLFFRIQAALSDVPSLRIPAVMGKTFFQMVCAITILLGECDKNPVAHRDIVQAQLAEVNVQDMLRRAAAANVRHGAAEASAVAVSRPPLVLDQFFASAGFKPYYAAVATGAASAAVAGITAEDKEAFLIALAANLGMVLELTDRFFAPTDTTVQREAKRRMARRLAEFIIACRATEKVEAEEGPVIYTMNDAGEVTIDIAKFRECLALYPDILDIVSQLFLQKIPGEQSFARKQQGGAARADADLRATMPLGLMDVTEDDLEGGSAAAEPADDDFSHPAAMSAHADNLGALKAFYDSLSRADQEQLLQELLLAVIFQAGHVHVVRIQQGCRPVPYFTSAAAGRSRLPVLPAHLTAVSDASYLDDDGSVHGADVPHAPGGDPYRDRAARSGAGDDAIARTDEEGVAGQVVAGRGSAGGRGSSYGKSPESRRRELAGGPAHFAPSQSGRAGSSSGRSLLASRATLTGSGTAALDSARGAAGVAARLVTGSASL